MRKNLAFAILSALVAGCLFIPDTAPLASVPPPTDGFGYLRAESNGKGVPRGSPVALELQWDNGAPGGGPLLAAARKAARRVLSAKGYRIDPHSKYVLLLNIDMPSFSALDDDDRDDTHVAGSGSDSVGAIPYIDDQWQIPFGRRPDVASASTIAVETTVYNRRGDVLWMATTEAAYDGSDPKGIIGRMVTATVTDIGTDAQRDFVLACKGKDKRAGVCLG